MPSRLPAALDTYVGDPAYARMLKQLLPRGLFNTESGSWLSRLLEACSFEFARAEGRGYDLVNEADPRTAVETLDDWERVLALPDADIVQIPSTPAERQVAVTQKFSRRGGQTPAYFVALAAACGYTVTIFDAYAPEVLRAGFRSGARALGVAWAYAWRVDVQPPAGAALSHAELEAVIRRSAPAHTVVMFTYL